jgi:DEAD/DEAH box helicase domain-containing protein
MLVCSSAPLDQYVASDAEFVLRAPVEHARIDPDNVEVLVQHLKCAAFELPFSAGEAFRDVAAEQTGEALDYLAGHEVLHKDERTWHWATDAYPAANVSLRSVGWDNVVIIELPSDRTLAEMDWRSAHTMLHEQAIYQHDAEQFQVECLDLPNRKAYVRRVEPDYFTTALKHTRVEVLSEAAREARASVTFGSGEVSVIEKVVGFKKVKFHTHENVGYGEVALPELQMHSTAFWLTVPDEVVGSISAPRVEVIDALRGLSTAMHSVACVGLMIDPRDLGRTLGSRVGQPLMEPTLYFYDEIPGGVGLAPRLFEERDALLARARRLIDACPCSDGCPACIGLDVGIGAPRKHGRKRLASVALERLFA